MHSSFSVDIIALAEGLCVAEAHSRKGRYLTWAHLKVTMVHLKAFHSCQRCLKLSSSDRPTSTYIWCRVWCLQSLQLKVWVYGTSAEYLCRIAWCLQSECCDGNLCTEPIVSSYRGFHMTFQGSQPLAVFILCSFWVFVTSVRWNGVILLAETWNWTPRTIFLIP